MAPARQAGSIQAKCSMAFSICSTICFSSGKTVWTVNLSAVLGQLANGSAMSKSTFTTTERYVTEINPWLKLERKNANLPFRVRTISKVCQQSQLLQMVAGRREATHTAIAPSLHGVAVIIGHHTNSLACGISFVPLTASQHHAHFYRNLDWLLTSYEELYTS